MIDNRNPAPNPGSPFLRILPNSVRSPAGLEWRIMKKLPLVLLASTLIPAGAYLLTVLAAGADTDQKQLTTIAILAIALVVTLWTAILTVAIGCAVVWIMKGPAYVADGYPVSDRDRPRQSPALDNDRR